MTFALGGGSQKANEGEGGVCLFGHPHSALPGRHDFEGEIKVCLFC